MSTFVQIFAFSLAFSLALERESSVCVCACFDFFLPTLHSSPVEYIESMCEGCQIISGMAPSTTISVFVEMLSSCGFVV